MDTSVQALAGLMALVLTVVGLLEVTQYRNPRFRSIFLIEPDQRDAVRLWVVNVGFYNLTFAAGIALGLVLVNQGQVEAGRALVLFLAGAHIILGAVLVAVEPRLWRNAVGEAGVPAVMLGLALT